MPYSAAKRRPTHLRRTWLFSAGADAAAQGAALDARPDVLVPDLEDLTPPALRPRAREMILALLEKCRKSGIVGAVRVNPLASEGRNDLAVVMQARPAAVFLPKTAAPEQIVELDRAIADHERRLTIPTGSTEIVPNIETATGLVGTAAIAKASKRVKACLVAAEDMAADLGAERAPDGLELVYVRQRFLVECVAAGVMAIDAPYTFSDVEGARADTLYARRLGYRAKGVVVPAHVAPINTVLTPDAEAIARARRMVEAFDAARAAGRDRVEMDGALVEVPTYLNAKRLIARDEELRHARGGSH
ncbi:MAG TPA: CoA ester lyase [Burkholderiales bacterium]|nr:CoA ester lyase [Burkholderiales bacterium]